uniref:Uncharacterized protein n=1 Tax=Oryctolagus cuniculus TaxID=9986 RepID=U3KNC9_RABIT
VTAESGGGRGCGRATRQPGGSQSWAWDCGLRRQPGCARVALGARACDPGLGSWALPLPCKVVALLGLHRRSEADVDGGFWAVSLQPGDSRRRAARAPSAFSSPGLAGCPDRAGGQCCWAPGWPGIRLGRLADLPSPRSAQGSREPGETLPRKLKQVLGQACWLPFENLLRQGTEVGAAWALWLGGPWEGHRWRGVSSAPLPRGDPLQGLPPLLHWEGGPQPSQPRPTDGLLCTVGAEDSWHPRRWRLACLTERCLQCSTEPFRWLQRPRPGGWGPRGSGEEEARAPGGTGRGHLLTAAVPLQVYKGYVDDPRNTDNAWIETVAVSVHFQDQQDVELTRLNPDLQVGDQGMSIQWQVVDRRIPLYGNQKPILQRAATLFGAHY